MLFESAGDLLSDFADVNGADHLVVMPIARTHVEWSARAYPGPTIFYPPGDVELERLNIIPNREDTASLAERCSWASGIDESVLGKHPLVAFPYKLDWTRIRAGSHFYHRELIRTLSEHVDRTCLNYVRYVQCPIDAPDCLPGRAGQVDSNHMMAGALLYSNVERQGRMIGGDAFTHFITRGLGLPIQSIEPSYFPRAGEVGRIVNHALMLYRDVLEASCATSQFVQCLSLMEFLVDPEGYTRADRVRKIVARYAATEPAGYARLLERLVLLTGKRDDATGRHVGYRTRIVHIGDRIDDIVPDSIERRELFVELGGYVKHIVDHMVEHSETTLAEYLTVRESLRPFRAESRVPTPGPSQ